MFPIVFLSFMISLGIFIAVKGLREWDETNFVIGIGMGILFALMILGTTLEYSLSLQQVGAGVGIGSLLFIAVYMFLRLILLLVTRRSERRRLR